MRGGIAVLALAGVGCRSEFVIGVLEQHASSEGTSTSDATSTSGSTTVASEASSADATSSSSSTGPSCAEEDDGDASETTGASPMCMAPTGHSQCDQND